MRAVIRALKVIWQAIQSAGKQLGKFNTLLLMAISFILVVSPMGMIRRLTLRPAPKGWLTRPKLDPHHFRKQF